MTDKERGGEIKSAIRRADFEILALAEVLKIAVPGLKFPHVTMAARMRMMLNKRGVDLCRQDISKESR